MNNSSKKQRFNFGDFESHASNNHTCSLKPQNSSNEQNENTYQRMLEKTIMEKYKCSLIDAETDNHFNILREYMMTINSPIHITSPIIESVGVSQAIEAHGLGLLRENQLATTENLRPVSSRSIPSSSSNVIFDEFAVTTAINNKGLTPITALRTS